MPALSKLLGSVGIDKIVDSVASAADDLFTSKEEKAQLKLELEKAIFQDRSDARRMYENNSSLQKVYAIVFLVSYVFLTAGMLVFVIRIAKGGTDIPDWAIGFISSIWGGMSTKVGTITDFLFGSSKSSQDKNEIIKIK